jgi:hypothetical protein
MSRREEASKLNSENVARRQEKSGNAESRVEKKGRKRKRKRKSSGIRPLLPEEWNAQKNLQKGCY